MYKPVKILDGKNIKWFMDASNNSVIFVRQLNSQDNRKDSSKFLFSRGADDSKR